MRPEPFKTLATLDRLVHDPSRLAILTALWKCGQVDFQRLLSLTALTKGNLSVHLTKLERGGLVMIGELPPGANGAVVAVATDAGVNAAVVHRVGERFAVGAWVGKSWGSKIQGGGAIRASW